MLPPPPEGLAPKRPPVWASWKDLGRRPLPGDPFDPFVHVWTRGRLTVFSTLVWADFRGTDQWQFLISVSARGKFPEDHEVERALQDFDMTVADEDNHESGAGVRKYYLPCAWKPGDPTACECKETEQVVTEPNGYRWQAEHGADLEAKRVEQEAINRAARMGLRR